MKKFQSTLFPCPIALPNIRPYLLAVILALVNCYSIKVSYKWKYCVPAETFIVKASALMIVNDMFAQKMK